MSEIETDGDISNIYERTVNINYSEDQFWNELIAEIGSKIEYPEEV